MNEIRHRDKTALIAQRLARRDHGLERCDGRGVGDPVHPGGTEMALECNHDLAGRAVEAAGGGNVVAVFAEQRLHVRNCRIAFILIDGQFTDGLG